MSSTLAVDVILRPRLGQYYSARRQRVAINSTQAVYFDVVNVLTGALVPGATGASALAWLPGTAGTDAPGQPLDVTEPTPGTLRVDVPSDIPGTWRVWMQITGPSVETGEIVYDVPEDGGAPTELSLDAWRSLQAAGAAAGASAGAVEGKRVVAGAVAEAAQPYIDEAAAQATAAGEARSLAEGAQAESTVQAGVAQDASSRSNQAAALADQKALQASIAAAQALVAGTLYPDTAAGLAATAPNGYFSVAAEGDSFAILYRNEAGVAVEKNRYPSQAKIDAFPVTTVPGAYGWDVAITTTLAAGRDILGGVRDGGREWQLAGMRVRDMAGEKVFTALGRLGIGFRLDALGLSIDGSFGPSGGPRTRLLPVPVPGIEQAHTDADGVAIFGYGPRKLIAAGMTMERRADNTTAIIDRQTMAPLLSTDADGRVSARGVLLGTVYDRTIAGSPILALTYPSVVPGVRDVLSLTMDSDGVVRRQGTAGTSALPYNSARRFGITGSGDESVALMSARDAAAAAGLRVLDCEALNINAPTADALGDIILVGQGKLSGPYRKRMIPPNAGAPAPQNSVASWHLPQFSAGQTAVVVGIGDSTMAGSDALNGTEGQWSKICAKFRRDNPGVNFTFYNRAIPSQTWATMDGVSTNTAYAWYSPTSRAWLGFVQDLAPDVVVSCFGMNDRQNFDLTKFLSVQAKLDAFPKVPRRIFCTNNVPTLQNPLYSAKVDQEGRDFVAGYQRTYAMRNGYGLMDFHRQFVAVRDGYDAVEQPLEALVLNTAGQIPYVFPEECTRFSAQMLFASAAAMFTAGKVLAINLSSRADNLLLLKDVGGFIAYQIQTAAERVVVPYTTTTFASSPSALRLAFSVDNRGWLTLEINRTPVFEGQVERFGGLYAPRIGYLAGFGDATTVACTIEQASVGRLRLYMPQATDAELYGTAGGPTGGNDINHLTSVGVAQVYAPVIEATTLTLPR